MRADSICTVSVNETAQLLPVQMFKSHSIYLSLSPSVSLSPASFVELEFDEAISKSN